ncbi:carbohydrate porin [Sulfurovum sp.]|uniref:carbohydrate porin n=1 Tax=Sulfurovum sp. TaxID=1969726 RepID=UPI0025FCAF56|nr:carbohydrate porin [Sulfurovum sp.]
MAVSLKNKGSFLRCFTILAVLTCFVSAAAASETGPIEPDTNTTYDNGYFTSQNAVESLLASDRRKMRKEDISKRYKSWKASLKKDDGFDFGIDYHVVGFHATASNGDKDATSGVVRLFGNWELVGRGTENSGSLVFKVEHRQAYTAVSPVDFGAEVGYAGLFQSTFSDQKGRLTNLYWKQNLLDSRMMVYAGFLDVTDYVDVYLMASPWDGFGNLVFATGSATIGSLPDGALGVMASGWLTDKMYVVAGIADANPDQKKPFDGFNTLFEEGETFKSLEFGWTTSKERLFFDNFHLTLWQVDEREKAGIPSGKGLSFSLVKTLNENMMAFLRGGRSDGSGSILETSVSAGIGYLQPEYNNNVLGVGLNWGQPNKEVYGDDAEDQGTMEVFYRVNTKYFQITPSLQVIVNPVSNTDKNVVAVFGLRLGTQF